MKFGNISVIGLGLIGGSLCRALRDSGQVGNVTGIDADKSVTDYALYNGFADSCTTSFIRGVDTADIVVICTHVNTIAEIAVDIQDLVHEGCVITDVGSVKGEIVRRVHSSLPQGIYFVGGHPIAGTENSGIRNSDAELFRGKRVFLTPVAGTGKEHVEKLRDMWELAGGVVSEIPPDVHDRIFSLVSHLPHVVAYSLVDAVSAASGVENIFDYAGGGLNDFTRVASSSPEMWKEILLMNRDNVLDAVKAYRKSLGSVESALEAGDEQALEDFLKKVSEIKRGPGEQ